MEQSFGKYMLLRQLGAGAASNVYLARDGAGSVVALKILHRELVSHSDHMKRFRNEAEWMSAINHPNVVSVLDVGEADGRPFIATEYSDGQTLREFIPMQMPIAQILSVAIGVSHGLAAIHRQWLVHRDIKPENIWLGHDGSVKILDFGFAKLTRPTGVPIEKLTRPGAVIGTLSYLAPEQLLGWGVDPRADIFSLGVVLFEMVTGFPPFDAPTNRELIENIVRSDPPPIVLSRDDLPDGMEGVIDKCLAKDPDARYQTATELLEDLELLAAEFHTC